jgi:hypothetical protein
LYRAAQLLSRAVDEPGVGRCRSSVCVYIRRMPRIQVYLADDLHRALKRSGLSPSELLQDAVRAELQRREQVARLDEYLSELEHEVGKPSRADKNRADALVKKIARRRTTKRAS